MAHLKGWLDVAVIVAEKTICHALPQWKRTTNDQNGGSMSSQKPLGDDEDQNNKLLLDLLKTELKDTLVRHEVPLALASVEGPWTPESGNFVLHFKFPTVASCDHKATHFINCNTRGDKWDEGRLRLYIATVV